jgi:hypothetical protein
VCTGQAFAGVVNPRPETPGDKQVSVAARDFRSLGR